MALPAYKTGFRVVNEKIEKNRANCKPQIMKGIFQVGEFRALAVSFGLCVLNYLLMVGN